MYICIYTKNSALIFFLREKLKHWPKYTISFNLCETSLSWLSEKLFIQISFWQWMSKSYMIMNVTIINQLCVSDYYWFFNNDFSLRLPINNAWHCLSICAALSSNVEVWDMWACSLFLSLQIKISFLQIKVFHPNKRGSQSMAAQDTGKRYPCNICKHDLYLNINNKIYVRIITNLWNYLLV